MAVNGTCWETGLVCHCGKIVTSSHSDKEGLIFTAFDLGPATHDKRTPGFPCVAEQVPILYFIVCSTSQENFKTTLKGSTFFFLLLLFWFSCTRTMTENTPESVSETEKQSEIEDLIAELCLNTSSNSVKFCLRKYQYGKSVAQIEKDIYKEKVELLKETAEFLKIQHFEDKTKKALSHLITCKIQNLLPDNCSVCKRRYRISLGDCPILECAICGQGVHKPCWLNLASIGTNNFNEPVDAEVFKTMVNPLNLPGMFYICDPCKVTTIPSDEEGNSKRKKRTKSTSQTQNTHYPTNTEVEDTTLTVTIDPTNDVDQSSQHNSSVGKQSQDSETNEARRDKMKGDGKKSPQICKFYKNGTCKHGLKGKECNYTHPKMCRNFIQHGTKQPRGTLELNARIFIQKCVLIPFGKENAFQNPVVLLM